MPYTVVEKINPYVKYDVKQNDDIVNTVKEFYEKKNEERKPQLTQIEIIKKILSVNDVISDGKDINSFQEEYKETQFGNIFLKDSSIKRIYNTSIAHLYNSTFKALHNIFSVELPPEYDSQTKAQFSAMQKQSLLNLIKKSKPNNEFRKGCENWFSKGEIIFKITWKRRLVDVRRKASFDFMGISIPLNKFEYQRVVKYDGISIESIDPEDFVYDTGRDDFETAFKTRSVWMPLQDVLNNQEYKKYLTQDQIIDLKNKDSNNEQDYVKDKMVKVLECEGDFYLTSGKGKDEFYPNMKICIIAGRYVGYFGYNPNVTSSYVISRYETDPETGRGIPLLSCLVSNSLAITDTLNKLKTALALSIFPHFFMSSDAFQKLKDANVKNGNFKNGIDLCPSGITPIYLNDGESLNTVMKELEMKTGLNIGTVLIEFFKAEGEEMSQRFKLSSGDAPKQARTLGENKMVMQGQNVLFGYEFDKVIDLILEITEKVGEIQANVDDEPENIEYKDEYGNVNIGVMNSEVKQADYTYMVNSSSTSMDKKLNREEFIGQFMEILPMLQQLGWTLNVEEFLNWLAINHEQDGVQKLLTRQPQLPQLPQGGVNEQQGAIPPMLPPNASPGVQGGLPMG